jgi:hypothetical protein
MTQEEKVNPFTDLEEEDLYPFVQEVVEELMKEECLHITQAVKTLSHYWSIPEKKIRTFLQGSKFDSRKGNQVVAIINGKDIKSSNFLYLSSSIVTRMIRDIINEKKVDIFRAACMALMYLNYPITPKNLEMVGICLKSRLRYDLYSWKGNQIVGLVSNTDPNFWNIAFSTYRKQIKWFLKKGVNVRKSLGYDGFAALGFANE